MVSSVRVTDHPAGEWVVPPKASPAGAWSTTLTRLTVASLAALSVRKVGRPVANVFGLISSWAEAGAADQARATAARTRAERIRIAGISFGVSRRPRSRPGA